MADFIRHALRVRLPAEAQIERAGDFDVRSAVKQYAHLIAE